MKIDARSDKIALHYTGNDAGEPAISGVPARDLIHNDVARLVYVEHGELHGAAHQAAVDALVDRLTEGPYRVTAAVKVKVTVHTNVTVTDKVSDKNPAEPSADQPKEV